MREHRLGLALSGGGFRASLFHLGVLRRLAELGLLRHVTHFSTVSGGSIVAAHYYLHFKRMFEEQDGVLGDEDYQTIVRNVEEEFVKGVGADIRNRLLSNPIAHFNELTSGNGFGRQMARLYTQHFYKSVIRKIFRDEDPKLLKSYLTRGVPLHQVITRRPGDPRGPFVNRSSSYPNTSEPERALVDFNENEVFANIPMLVINSTCLNTGGPFYFTINEVGGPECGFVRTDEVFMLLQYKTVLDSLGDEPVEATFLEKAFKVALTWGTILERARPELPKTAFKRTVKDASATAAFPPHTPDHLSFYQAARARYRLGDEFGEVSWIPPGFEFPTGDFVLEGLKQRQYWPMIRHLLEVDFGTLRRAKAAAWNLLDRIGWADEKPDTRRGGFTRDEYEAELMRALRSIDPELAIDFTLDGEVHDSLTKLILDLYYFRSAAVLHARASEALHRITLSHAAAASANFPPMFTPFKINELFATKHMNSVYLTDGGVHDNQGIEWLLEAGCTHIIASDAGGLVSLQNDPAEARLPMMDRIIDVLMGGVRRVLLRSVRDTCHVSDLLARTVTVDDNVEEFEELRRSTHLKRATVFHMSSDPRDAAVPPAEQKELLKPFAPQLVAGLRTDLDVFNDIEIAALRHQGYQLADCYARKMADLPPFRRVAGRPKPISPAPELPSRPTAHHKRVLTAGGNRMGRYSNAYPFVAAFGAALFALIISLTARKLDEWTSWTSIRRLLGIRITDERQSLYSALQTTDFWQTLTDRRAVVVDFIAHTNILTVMLGGWALFLVCRELFRASHEGRKRVLVQISRLMRRDMFGGGMKLLKRPANSISIAALLLYATTLHSKWLLAVIHLWIVPVCLFFGVVHVVFSKRWQEIGRHDPPALAGGTALEPVPDAVA